MVNYYLGYDREKRLYFRSQGYLLLDNSEVLLVSVICGREYFAYCTPPFDGFTAGEAVRYSRALNSFKVDFNMFPICLGVTEKRPMRSLDVVARRAVQYLMNVKETTNRIAINLDGTRYTKKRARLLNCLIDAILSRQPTADIAVLVSDKAFCPTAALTGIYRKVRPPRARLRIERMAFYNTARKLGATKINRFSTCPKKI